MIKKGFLCLLIGFLFLGLSNSFDSFLEEQVIEYFTSWNVRILKDQLDIISKKSDLNILTSIVSQETIKKIESALKWIESEELKNEVNNNYQFYRDILISTQESQWAFDDANPPNNQWVFQNKFIKCIIEPGFCKFEWIEREWQCVSEDNRRNKDRCERQNTLDSAYMCGELIKTSCENIIETYKPMKEITSTDYQNQLKDYIALIKFIKEKRNEDNVLNDTVLHNITYLLNEVGLDIWRKRSDWVWYVPYLLWKKYSYDLTSNEEKELSIWMDNHKKILNMLWINNNESIDFFAELIYHAYIFVEIDDLDLNKKIKIWNDQSGDKDIWFVLSNGDISNIASKDIKLNNRKNGLLYYFYSLNEDKDTKLMALSSLLKTLQKKDSLE